MKLIEIRWRDNRLFVFPEHVAGWGIAAAATLPKKRGLSSPPPQSWKVTLYFPEGSSKGFHDFVYDTREEAYAAVRVIDV